MDYQVLLPSCRCQTRDTIYEGTFELFKCQQPILSSEPEGVNETCIEV